MTYSYTINGTDVNALGDWEINYEKNEGQIFARRILTGDLTFRGDDYDTIMAIDDCDVLEFKIYCGASEHWEGQFKFPYDFDIDEDSCVLAGTPEVVDEYSCIMNGYDQKFEVTPAGAPVNPELFVCGGALLRILPAAFTLEGYIDGTINGVGALNCGLTLKSSFLWEDNFPNGTNYAGAYGANNYITGAANRLDRIYLVRNTTLRGSLGGTLCDGNDSLEWSWKDFEEVLRNRFNAYWYIDQNGEFRIEHIHFFDPDFVESDFVVGVDLTTLVSSNGKVFAYRRNKYTYETGDLYDQEFFSWQHYEGTEGTIAHGVDFEGVPIFYGAAVDQKSDCVPGEFKEKEIATPNFWSDIDWAFALLAAGTPDTIACPGFVMLDVLAGTDVIRCEVGAFSGVNTANGHLSTANLQDHYFTWDRIFLDGDMNFGGASPVVLFDSAQRLKLQEAIEFEWCCIDDFNPMNLIKTELGDGKIKAVTQKKRSIEVELLY